LLGEIGNAREREPVARALRPPLQLALRSGLGRWPTQGLQRSDSANHIPESCSAASTGKCGTLPFWRALSDQYRRLAAPSGGKAGREIHERCGAGWLALRRIYFWKVSCHESTRILTDKTSLSLTLRQPSVKDLFSQGFHSILAGLHSFSTNHLAFRFVFAYASGEFRTQCCTQLYELWRPLITTSALFPRT